MMEMKSCRRCKRPFPKINNQSLYCTDSCKQAAYRERQQCPHCGGYLVANPKQKRTRPLAG